MPDPEREERVIPILEEQLIAESEPVKTGSVRIQKHIQKAVKRVEGDVLRESAEVKRVPVNKVVKDAPKVRTVGDTIIVPILEEEVIVTKRLVLKEELHITRRKAKERVRRDVTVNRERAEVLRIDAHGRVIDPPPRPPKPRGFLG